MPIKMPKRSAVLRDKPSRIVSVEYRTSRGRTHKLVFRHRDEAADCIYTRAVCEGGIIPTYVYETIGEENMKYLKVNISIGVMGEMKVTLRDIREKARNKRQW